MDFLSYINFLMNERKSLNWVLDSQTFNYPL
jgi:hypothetical protein